MSEVLEFITSEEVVIVGIVIAAALFLALIVFLIEKSYYKHKNKKLKIDLIVEEMEQEDKLNNGDITPVIQLEKDNNQELNKEEKNIEVLPIEEEKPAVIPIEEFNEETATIIDTETTSIESIFNEVKDEVELLQYTDPEPNQEEAKEELRKVTEELLKKAEEENKTTNIDLTKFEEEQEENAIISMDELMKKSEVLYQQNEITQYEDEGNEPISLEDLELRMNNIKNEIEKIENDNVNDGVSNIKDATTKVIEEKPKIKLDDLNTVKAYRDDAVFKSSPIISPIFGIEDNKNDSSMELENTANYDKLDQEIKKTNSFLAVLKELQKKLD